MEGKNPRTGLPMTAAEKKKIEENDDSIYEPTTDEDYPWL